MCLPLKAGWPTFSLVSFGSYQLRLPHPSRFSEGGLQQMFTYHKTISESSLYLSPMPRRLRRKNNTGHLHFITTSCFRRRSFFATARRRDLVLEIFEQVRRRYNCLVVGYVVMPEHIHLLIGEPERGNISTVMQVLTSKPDSCIPHPSKTAKGGAASVK